MPTRLDFHDRVEPLTNAQVMLLIGRRHALLSDRAASLLPSSIARGVWENMVGTSSVTDDGRASSTWLTGAPERLVAGILPDACSRHNAPSRAWATPHIMAAARGAARTAVIVFVDDAAHAAAHAIGIARALPTFHSTADERERTVDVLILGPDGPVSPARLGLVADAVRRAAHLVDMPPNLLGPRAMVAEAERVAAATGAAMFVVAGNDLRDQGFGGLWGVGKAATEPPALVVLDYDPQRPGARRTCWVGKGILFDTGGLSLKDKSSMPSMKTDMAGAAAVLAAFEAACRLGVPDRLTAVLCLAENAVGPGATRPDDVLRMYSGRTVEVNNTDAEGRLVLADGIAWACRHRDPDLIIDLATLTGAQATATGKRHAAVISNDAQLEAQSVAAGLRTGEVVWPLPFCPEFYRREFQSKIADMKNSVKDRNNAQSSCAATFIHLHLDHEDRPWLHVDMAAPAVSAERGTGYGVGLLLGMAGLI